MKKTFHKIIYTVVFVFMVFCVFSTVYAEYTYTPLVPLPGIDNTTSSSLSTYIPNMFYLAIGISAVLAFVMITFGGIMYATSDAISGKSEGKDYVTNAVYGLILVIGAWVILYTINPKILKFSLDIETPNIAVATSTSATAGVPMTQEEISASDAVRARLKLGGVEVNAGPCTQGQSYGCTNLNGLPEIAIGDLVALKKDCNCTIFVTGGTEPGPHATHGVGKAIVDLRTSDDLASWLKKKNYLRTNGTSALVPLSTGRNAILIYESASQGASTGNHWHVTF